MFPKGWPSARFFCRGETKEKALFLSLRLWEGAFLIILKNPSLRLNNGYICDCLKEYHEDTNNKPLGFIASLVSLQII